MQSKLQAGVGRVALVTGASRGFGLLGVLDAVARRGIDRIPVGLRARRATAATTVFPERAFELATSALLHR